MLRYFFDMYQANENSRLYTNTLIDGAKTMRGVDCMSLQGQFPTIFLTLKDVRSDCFAGAMEKLKIKVSDLYQEHAALLQSYAIRKEEKTDIHKNNAGRQVDIKA